MTTKAKSLWDALKIEMGNRSGPVDPGRAERIDAAMKPAYDLLKAFEIKRDRQPFTSQVPCPYCEAGTVTYSYKAPLFGSLKCDTCECVSINL